MDYATLQSNVESALGRSDVPSYVYTLTTAAVNRDMSLLDMQDTATLTTATHPIDLSGLDLPFHSVLSLYAEIGGEPHEMEAVTEFGAHVHTSTGTPRFYAVRGSELWLDPVPDGTYTLNLVYNGHLADLSGDTDTNAVMSRYPDLYLYCALTHASIWAGDDQRLSVYGPAYSAAVKAAQKDDTQRRMGTSLVPRSKRW
jgi:hypothetical protein